MECTNCGKPATLVCSGCSRSPRLIGDSPAVRYCGSRCQMGHWKDHKVTCRLLKDRQMVYRVASLAQQLFYMSQELQWYTFDITHVDHDPIEEDCFIAFPESPRTQLSLNFHGKNLMEDGTPLTGDGFPIATRRTALPFPVHLLPSKEEQEAVLSYSGCVMASYWMVEFIKGMLGNIVKETQAVVHRTKGEKRRTKFKTQISKSLSGLVPGWNTRREIHTVLKLTLRSGEVFAVDLSGAQLGHHEPVLRWSEYSQERILIIREVEEPPIPIGLLHVHDYSDQKILYYQSQIVFERDLPTRLIIHDILKVLNIGLLKWQEKNISLKILWGLPQDEFLTRQKDLVDYAHWLFTDTTSNSSKTVRGIELRNRPRPLHWQD